MKLFITGIGTNVGKTITSTIITQALKADYWKPIQAGDLNNSDSHFVASKINNSISKIHPNAYAFATPVSPHLAAKIEEIIIDVDKIIEPETQNHLVIEAAGGIFVPLNQTNCIIDLIKNDYKVIVVSRHYLGSINHTLLTIEALKARKIEVAGIVFSGNENKASEEIILSKTSIKYIGRIDDEPYFDKNVIEYYADMFLEKLLDL